MNNQLVIVTVVVVVIFLLGISTGNYTLPPDARQKEDILKSTAHIIATNMPGTGETNDLQFLKETLHNADIVMLGEQNHYQDGSTFLAKGRLIEFLIGQMDFDVVIYETGYYDTELLQEDIQYGHCDLFSFSRALWWFWWNTEEAAHTTNNICQCNQGPSPIAIAGFDVQLSGKMPGNTRDSVLSKYLSLYPEIDSAHYPAFFSVKGNLEQLFWGNRIEKAMQASVIKDLNGIIKQIANRQNKNATDSLYYRYLSNLGTTCRYTWQYEYGSEERFSIRDSAMADNLIYLMEHKYKGRKVIVWSANMHVSYNNSQFETPVQFKSMGQYIKERYGDSCYAINFTHYVRKDKSGNSSMQTSSKSVEYLMHQAGFNNAFIDFRTLDTSSFLNGNIMLRCKEDMNLNARWSKMIDGLFYIDTMLPTHILYPEYD